jgi:hypothetical protein
MTYLKLHLAPVPHAIKQNLITYLTPIANKHARTLLYLDPILTANLWARGAFSDLKLLGILTDDCHPNSFHFTGLTVYSFDDLPLINPDSVVVTDYRNHNEISHKLSPLSKKYDFKIIDLCLEFEELAFRREWAEELKREVFSNEISDFPAQHVEIEIPSTWGFGDKLCALSTAREFARRHPAIKVHFQHIPEIVSAYGDDLVTSDPGSYIIPYQEPHFYRERDSSVAGNYLGCYYLNFGLHFDSLPNLELPYLPPCPDLKPNSYIALQPSAGWAKPNLSSRRLETIIQKAPLPVVVVGKPSTPKNIRGADFDHLGSPIEMLRVIQHAAFMLTPRSASAHIASGYRVPSLIWVPDDGENWHLSYPGWDYKLIRVRNKSLANWIVKEMFLLKERIDANGLSNHCTVIVQNKLHRIDNNFPSVENMGLIMDSGRSGK